MEHLFRFIHQNCWVLPPHRQHFQNQKSHGNDAKKSFQRERRASKYRGPSKLPTRDDPYDLPFNGGTTKPLATTERPKHCPNERSGSNVVASLRVPRPPERV